MNIIASATAMPSARAHVAPNVVSLFADERPPVANPPRGRGRLPRNVVRLGSRPRLAIGDLCEMCRGALPENHGKHVRVVGFADSGLVEIDAVSAPIDAYCLESGERLGQFWKSTTWPANLRRVPNALRIAQEGRRHG